MERCWVCIGASFNTVELGQALSTRFVGVRVGFTAAQGDEIEPELGNVTLESTKNRIVFHVCQHQEGSVKDDAG